MKCRTSVQFLNPKELGLSQTWEGRGGGWRGGGDGINKNGIHSLHQNIFHTEQRVKHENLNRVILEEGIIK